MSEEQHGKFTHTNNVHVAREAKKPVHNNEKGEKEHHKKRTMTQQQDRQKREKKKKQAEATKSREPAVGRRRSEAVLCVHACLPAKNENKKKVKTNRR